MLDELANGLDVAVTGGGRIIIQFQLFRQSLSRLFNGRILHAIRADGLIAHILVFLWGLNNRSMFVLLFLYSTDRPYPHPPS